MHAKYLANLMADGKARVEGRDCVLEHQGDATAARGAALAGGHGDKITVAKLIERHGHLSACHLPE